jgi:uncharacterized membrane protein YfcA
MSRLFSWVLAIISFLALIFLVIGSEFRHLINIPSAVFSFIFPVLIMLSIYEPSQLVRAIRDLSAPADAGLSADRLREDAQIFNIYGTLSIAAGIIASFLALIFMLSALESMKDVIVNISVSMITILYSLMVFFFISFPASWILTNNARKATLIEDEPK